MLDINAAVEAMSQHSREFPGHGYNCACKDKYIGQVRNQFENEEDWTNFLYLAACIQKGYTPDPVLRARGIIK